MASSNKVAGSGVGVEVVPVITRLSLSGESAAMASEEFSVKATNIAPAEKVPGVMTVDVWLPLNI
jgi:hypothetical protein